MSENGLSLACGPDLLFPEVSFVKTRKGLSVKTGDFLHNMMRRFRGQLEVLVPRGERVIVA
jgi:hypothetical protein